MKDIALSLLFGFVVGLLLTELLRSAIFFSLFVGIPGGILAATLCYVLLRRMRASS